MNFQKKFTKIFNATKNFFLVPKFTKIITLITLFFSKLYFYKFNCRAIMYTLFKICVFSLRKSSLRGKLKDYDDKPHKIRHRGCRNVRC